jgi:DNA-binding NtrC family response regulator
MPKSNKVLIVDDEPLVALHLEAELETLGYTILGTAASLAEVRALVEREPPGLALVDVNIRGEKNGIFVAEELFSRFGTQIIFMSGIGEVPANAHSPALEPVADLQKPFSAGNLARAIERSNVKPSVTKPTKTG